MSSKPITLPEFPIFERMKPIEIPIHYLKHMPFLAPTDKDIFEQKITNTDTYFITLKDPACISSFSVKDEVFKLTHYPYIELRINLQTHGISLTIIEIALSDDYHFYQLMGYIICKVMPKYYN